MVMHPLFRFALPFRQFAGPQPVSRAPLPLPLLLALLLSAGGCASIGLGGQPTGGLPPQTDAQLSLVVSQTRQQYPELSGTRIPYEARKAAEAAEPRLALRGDGVGISRGLQVGPRRTAHLEVHLDKRSYAAGFVQVRVGDGAEERWPVVAYRLAGEAEGAFAFTYVLADPAGRLRYLELIGGGYEADGAPQHGFEGTLVVPGAGGDLERWETAYKLDFGYRFPDLPVHQAQVNEADALYQSVKNGIADLERRKQRADSTAAELAQQKQAAEAAQANAAPAGAPVPPGGAARLPQPPTARDYAALEADLAAVTKEIESMGQRMIRYYTLRESIALAFTAYLETNDYLWKNGAGKKKVFEDWKVVELHHENRTVDTLTDRVAALMPAPLPLKQTRERAMAVVLKQNNWGRNPFLTAK